MTDNSISLQTLMDELVIYHSDLGLAICKQCQVAFSAHVNRHFREYHPSIDIVRRKALQQHIESLPGRRSMEEVNSELSKYNEVEMLNGLPVVDGLKCQECLFLGTDPIVIKHCQKEHGWINTKGTLEYVVS